MAYGRLELPGKVLFAQADGDTGATVIFTAEALAAAGWSQVTRVVVWYGQHDDPAVNKGQLLVRLPNRTTEDLGVFMPSQSASFECRLQSVQDRLAEGGGFIVSYDNTSGTAAETNSDIVMIVGE